MFKKDMQCNDCLLQTYNQKTILPNKTNLNCSDSEYNNYKITQEEITFTLRTTQIEPALISNCEFGLISEQGMSVCTIRFQVICETNFGEVVYICGNTPELGNWTPANAMRLYTDSALYPKWDPYKPILVRQNNKLLFKLCIMDQNSNIRWESIPHNREIIPTQNLFIQFTAHYEEITVTPIIQELPKPPRKKTCDILNQLESDGSSSHEYWKQFMSEEEEQSIMYITLLTQMRRIIEYGTEEQFIKNEEWRFAFINSGCFDSVLKVKVQKTRQIIKKTSHLYCIIEQGQDTIGEKCHNDESKQRQARQKQREKQKDQVLSVLGQQSYIVRRDRLVQGYSVHNNKVPIIFHVESIRVGEQNQSLEEIIQTIKKMVQAENKLSAQKINKLEYYISFKLEWEPNDHLLDLIINYRLGLVVVQQQRILQKLLDLLVLKGFKYEGIGDHLIVVQTGYLATLTIKVNVGTQKPLNITTALNSITHSMSHTNNSLPSPISFSQRKQLIDSYFTSLKQALFSQSNKSYQHLGKQHFIDSLKEDDMFLGLGYHRKNVFIINAELLESLSPKLLTEIIALSSRPNFEIFIILSKVNGDIKSRFPACKTNKLVVMGKNGLIYANQNVLIDIVSNLSLQKGKLCDCILKIVSSITMGLESRTQPTTSSIESQLVFKSTTIGKLGFGLAQNKVKQHNQNFSHYKLALQQVSLNTYLLKPYIFTQQFYLRSILENISKQVHDERTFILTANFKNDNNYLHKLCHVFSKVFKGKYNAKLRNMQVLADNDPEYSFIGREEIVNKQYIEGELQFLSEHFLGSSGVKSYNINMLSPPHKQHRRSFADKHLKQKHFDYSHENL